MKHVRDFISNTRPLSWFSRGTLVLLCVVIFALGVRGFPSNPTIETIQKDSRDWIVNGPLELSPERGRFALLYSFIEDGSLQFSLPVARLATPDLSMNGAGQYVSMFAPGVSFIVMPGYLLGKMLGAAQVGAYAVIALFALLNMVLVRTIARHLGAEPFAAALAALTFGFATPAFAYGVNLYQHHVSTFLMLLSVFLLLRFRNFWTLSCVWFACALSVLVVDNPNFFLMFPVGMYALTVLWQLVTREERGTTRIVFGKAVWSLLTFLTVALPIGFFLWYNQTAYGNPLQLPGTLRGVDEIGPDGKPAEVNTYEKEVGVVREKPGGETSTERTAVGFFETRNLYNGFYIHFLSPDRGILFFTPVILLGLFGLALLYRVRPKVAALFLAISGANVLLYSMWGDPWGGWAFGSRYLIPTYALLSIGIALGLSRFRFRLVFVALFIPLLVYSLWVNTLGAVTSSANPPKVEVLAIEQQTGHEQKYTFLRNWEYLHEKYEKVGSKSFAYQAWLKPYVSAPEYHVIVFGLALLSAGLAASGAFLERKKVSER